MRPVLRLPAFPDRVRRRARMVLAVFVATICVTLLAPFVHASTLEMVCTAQGSRLIVQGGDTTGHAGLDDHAAHCPLCMPAGAPPVAFFSWDFAPVQPLAHVQQSIPAARLASLVGAPLPARGPPLAS